MVVACHPKTEYLWFCDCTSVNSKSEWKYLCDDMATACEWCGCSRRSITPVSVKSHAMIHILNGILFPYIKHKNGEREKKKTNMRSVKIIIFCPKNVCAARAGKKCEHKWKEWFSCGPNSGSSSSSSSSGDGSGGGNIMPQWFNTFYEISFSFVGVLCGLFFFFVPFFPFFSYIIWNFDAARNGQPQTILWDVAWAASGERTRWRSFRADNRTNSWPLWDLQIAYIVSDTHENNANAWVWVCQWNGSLWMQPLRIGPSGGRT